MGTRRGVGWLLNSRTLADLVFSGTLYVGMAPENVPVHLGSFSSAVGECRQLKGLPLPCLRHRAPRRWQGEQVRHGSALNTPDIDLTQDADSEHESGHDVRSCTPDGARTGCASHAEPASGLPHAAARKQT